ncbi:S8 family serine peptidase [Streptomyces eurythermus]
MFAGVGVNAKEGNKPQYPAAYDDDVGVTAIDRTGTVAPTAQYGDHVDIAAPGVDIPRWCDTSFRRYCAHGGGTAAASALVSAQAALVWSKHRDWTAAQIWRVLEDTALRRWPVDTPSKYLGYGAARARQVVVLGRGRPGPPDPNTPPAYVHPLPAAPGSTPTPKASKKSTPAATADPQRDSGLPLTGLSIGAAVILVLGGAVWAALRRHARRPGPGAHGRRGRTVAKSRREDAEYRWDVLHRVQLASVADPCPRPRGPVTGAGCGPRPR